MVIHKIIFLMQPDSIAAGTLVSCEHLNCFCANRADSVGCC